MTTFTRISDDERPRISVDAEAVISKIEDNIYGGFAEHLGRCVYGGIYEPDSKLSDENGFRKDVIAAMKELNVPVVRYPGGNFCATYHWMDGVGPKHERPHRFDLAWRTKETNHFGTDEFMKWCELVGTEPYLCFNFGTGTLDEALAWVEYCNSDRDTYYANLRRKHGRNKPYNVKYWALGNECWGPWQVEQTTREAYAKKAYQWGKALKRLDPSIQLILCGKQGPTSWDAHVIKECIRHDGGAGLPGGERVIDMHSIHIYTSSRDHLKNATSPRQAETAIKVTSNLIDLARIENGVPLNRPKQKICFDEWNVWEPIKAPGSNRDMYTLSDALGLAVWLNVFVRQSQHVGMANLAQSVNVISPLGTTPNGIFKQATWYPLMLFSRHMRGQTLAVHLRCGEYKGDTQPGWIRGSIETPWLDVSAAKGPDGSVCLAVVNIHEEREFETDLRGVVVGGKTADGAAASSGVHVYTVTGKHVRVGNTVDKEEVGMEYSKWDGKGRFKFPKHSLTMLKWKP